MIGLNWMQSHLPDIAIRLLVEAGLNLIAANGTQQQKELLEEGQLNHSAANGKKMCQMKEDRS